MCCGRAIVLCDPAPPVWVPSAAPVSGSKIFHTLLGDFSPRGTYSFDPSSVTASWSTPVPSARSHNTVSLARSYRRMLPPVPFDAPWVIHRLPIPGWHAIPLGPSAVGSDTVLITAHDGTS